MKCKVQVGYTSGGLQNYKYWNRKRLEGADITAIDGLGNEIEVHVREDHHGYRVVVNGQEIANSKNPESPGRR